MIFVSNVSMLPLLISVKNGCELCCLISLVDICEANSLHGLTSLSSSEEWPSHALNTPALLVPARSSSQSSY